MPGGTDHETVSGSHGMTARPAVDSNPAAPRPGRPIIGAIRWDGHASQGSVGAQSAKCLSLRREYHDRIPFYGSLTDGVVELASDAPGIMEQDVAYARVAGLDYWAFDLYPEEPEEPGSKSTTSTMGMAIGLNQYLALADKKGLRFCAITTRNSGNSSDERWAATVSRLVAYFKNPAYQMVLGDRPLVYIYDADSYVRNAATCRTRIQMLRDRAKQAGCGNPYVAGLVWAGNPAFVHDVGGDAVSAYLHLVPSGQTVSPYSRLAAMVEAHWQSLEHHGVACIPTAQVGFNDRPMNELPVSWIKEPDVKKEIYEQGSAQEIAQHVKKIVDFTADNPSLCPANAVLIYAWMENIEGSWLVPTLQANGEINDSRVRAIGEAIATSSA
jgi:hypothetical protein